jgi:hypothetical protein
MTTEVVILRAAGSFAPRFARLKNATMVFFNWPQNKLVTG